MNTTWFNKVLPYLTYLGRDVDGGHCYEVPENCDVTLDNISVHNFVIDYYEEGHAIVSMDSLIGAVIEPVGLHEVASWAFIQIR